MFASSHSIQQFGLLLAWYSLIQILVISSFGCGILGCVCVCVCVGGGGGGGETQAMQTPASQECMCRPN